MPEFTQPDFRNLFAHQVSLADSEVDLQKAALCMAGEEYPDLDVEAYLARMDEMAGNVRSQVGAKADPEDLARELNHYLFDSEGFAGNSNDYYNSENSFLNRVMDNRVGIPITLSVLYLGIAKRLGLTCYGVGMPGHFLVNVQELDLYMDPFHSGQLLSAGDCRRLAQSMLGSGIEWNDDFLAPTSSKMVLSRMLNNLRHIYSHGGKLNKLGSVLERMLLIDESNVSLYKELAACQIKLGERDSAIRTLQFLTRQAEDERDIAAAKSLIDSLLQARRPED